jgi:hypothetical protein
MQVNKEDIISINGKWVMSSTPESENKYLRSKINLIENDLAREKVSQKRNLWLVFMLTMLGTLVINNLVHRFLHRNFGSAF